VREALKTLASEGLIVTRPGRSGGSEVVTPTAETLAQSVAVFIRGRRVTLRALIEMRKIIEPACAELAAERRTGEDLDALEQLNATMRATIDDTPAYLAANVDWHVRVAIASHNELLAGVLLAISRELHAGTEIVRLDDPRVREETVRAHEQIGRAISARQCDAARRRMLRHISAYGEELFGRPEQRDAAAAPARGGRSAGQASKRP
jgi:GntR family transcriptional regulator, transcriptional repressor for pyruvate dehydrogenase complex